ncbi:hypothetical protein GCM10010123_04800 [Pilimelia anulata]|uniref:Uncharacterized protein n=1 Tax=Pilimelia anulata TaxID=53371 RepID=A0A8J3B1U2_9ACTN|nr:hypothetical protein [Pilimelia anulata]GGJ77787.1 hypothetical protein GCM10010123_04800 [Pilimelia anulata]
MTAADAEVARLRAELDRLRAGRTGRFGRWVAAAALLLAAFLLGTVAVAAVFARNQLLDTDRYVATVAPLARDPVIQDALADRLTDVVVTHVDLDAVAARAAAWLREQGAPPQVDALVQPAVGGVRSLIRSTTRKLVGSDRFGAARDTANRMAHDDLVAVLTGGRSGALSSSGTTVTVDLGVFLGVVREKLVEAGLGLAARIPQVSIPFTVFSSPQLPALRTYVRWLDRTATWLPWLALLALAGAGRGGAAAGYGGRAGRGRGGARAGGAAVGRGGGAGAAVPGAGRGVDLRGGVRGAAPGARRGGGLVVRWCCAHVGRVGRGAGAAAAGGFGRCRARVRFSDGRAGFAGPRHGPVDSAVGWRWLPGLGGVGCLIHHGRCTWTGNAGRRVLRPTAVGVEGGAVVEPARRVGGAVAGGESFADALRGAIQRSGLSLDRIRFRLAQRGHPLSPATLSLWQSGLRRPERRDSLRTLSSLEEILALPAGALRCALGPPRQRGPGKAGQRRLPRETAWPHDPDLPPLLREVDDEDEFFVRLSHHDQIRVGPDGLERSLRVRLVLRAARSGLSRLPMVCALDRPHPRGPRVRALNHCSVAASEYLPETGYLVSSLAFDSKLTRGEAVMIEYEVTYPTRSGSDAVRSTFAERKLRFPVSEYFAEVRFDRRAVPARCASRATGADGFLRGGALPVDSARCARLAVSDAAPGRYALLWDWA